MSSMVELGKRVRAARKKLDVTIERAAFDMDIGSERLLRRIERGEKATLTPEIIKKLCDYFGFSPCYLLEGINRACPE